jgi:flagellin
MAFQVNANVSALNVYNNLEVHQAKSSASLARISSGLKAAGGGDIASQGTAATLNAATQVTQSSISQVQNAINRLQAADTAYGELIALGQKGLETASRLSDAGADVSALQASMTALSKGIASIQTNTQVNGTLWTTATAVDVGVGNFAAGPTLNTAVGSPFGLLEIATVTTPGSGTTALYTNYIEEKVNERATNAGNIASLQNTLQVLNSVAANELAGIGQAQDTDIAKEMMSLTSANIMTEAATAMLAQAMQLPNSVLKLLQ